MARKRFSLEQIIITLREVEVLLSQYFTDIERPGKARSLRGNNALTSILYWRIRCSNRLLGEVTMKRIFFFVLVVCALFGACKTSNPTTPESDRQVPIIDSFTVSASSVTVNQQVTLTWTTRFANGCTILPDIGSVPVSGSRVVTMTTVGTTSFQLKAVNADGTATSTCSVTVT